MSADQVHPRMVHFGASQAFLVFSSTASTQNLPFLVGPPGFAMDGDRLNLLD
jgi:hypothetical protein